MTPTGSARTGMDGDRMEVCRRCPSSAGPAPLGGAAGGPVHRGPVHSKSARSTPSRMIRSRPTASATSIVRPSGRNACSWMHESACDGHHGCAASCSCRTRAEYQRRWQGDLVRHGWERPARTAGPQRQTQSMNAASWRPRGRGNGAIVSWRPTKWPGLWSHLLTSGLGRDREPSALRISAAPVSPCIRGCRGRRNSGPRRRSSLSRPRRRR